MPKRKKRILFDVMGTGDGQEKVSVADKKSKRVAPVVRPSEVRLSYSMAGTFAVVFLVVVALAYYLGQRQGGPSEGGPKALQRTQATKAPARKTGDYSIRARRVRFNQYTRGQAKSALLADKKLLVEHGFRDVRLVQYTKGYAEGEGSFQLWVERANSFEELERITDKVRTLKDHEGKTPFVSAFPLKAR
jgi:hypothetical protein